MNDQFKEQITSLQKKIFELENEPKENDTKTNFDINELKQISEITIFYEMKKTETNVMRKKSKNENKDDEEENEEDEDFYDEDENIDEFIEKMKKLNHKKKDDNEEMNVYRKENRKMLARFEDALDENDELKDKMIKIEQLVTKKQNELFSSLKTYFKNMLSDFNITNNNKEKIISFMKLIQFSDEEMNYIISNNIKKNNLKFNIFK